MKLILGQINDKFLDGILSEIDRSNASSIDRIDAAVAYATDPHFFKWCFDKKIPLNYYGRLENVFAISEHILDLILNASLTRYPYIHCYLVEKHHAKVIWWHGFGVYIGSANFSKSAWTNNIECGCFFYNHEISSEMQNDLNNMFKHLEEIGVHILDLSESDRAAMRQNSIEIKKILASNKKSNIVQKIIRRNNFENQNFKIESPAINTPLVSGKKSGWQLLTKEHVFAAMDYISDVNKGGVLHNSDKHNIQYYARDCEYNFINTYKKLKDSNKYVLIKLNKESNTLGPNKTSFFKYNDKFFLPKALLHTAYDHFVEENDKFCVRLIGSSKNKNQESIKLKLNPKDEYVKNILGYIGMLDHLFTP